MIINGKEYTRENIGKIFDYAMLQSDRTEPEIREHINKAIKYNVAGVYCNPYWVPLIADLLEGTGIETGLCPDFPMGASSTSMKLFELEEMCEVMKGRPAAVDFVVNLAAVKDKKYDLLREESKQIIDMAHGYGYQAKAIFENGHLTYDEIAAGCQIVTEVGADFVKCATGRANNAPELETVKVMRANIPDHVKIKYAGYGTFNLAQLTIMGLATGVDVFGTGFAHTIIEEIERNYKDLEISYNE